MSIALIRDICTAPVNIYTITTNCSSPKKQNSKKKKKAFTFLLSFISLTNTILFPKIVRWPRSKITFSLVPKESFGNYLFMGTSFISHAKLLHSSHWYGLGRVENKLTLKMMLTVNKGSFYSMLRENRRESLLFLTIHR